MNRAVESGTHEIVHARINNDEPFATILFYVENAREKDSRGRDDGSARLEQQMNARRLTTCATWRAYSILDGGFSCV